MRVCVKFRAHVFLLYFEVDRVVRKPVNANPGLKVKEAGKGFSLLMRPQSTHGITKMHALECVLCSCHN